jgi:hypothetical protein
VPGLLLLLLLLPLLLVELLQCLLHVPIPLSTGCRCKQRLRAYLCRCVLLTGCCVRTLSLELHSAVLVSLLSVQACKSSSRSMHDFIVWFQHNTLVNPKASSAVA